MVGNWMRKILGFGGEVAADAALIKGIPALFNWLKRTHESLPPELKEEAKKILLRTTADGRTRSDELVFFASLVTLQGVSAENKKLFLQKHYELLHPKITPRTSPKKVAALRQKQKLAEGLIFLIAEDSTAQDVNLSKRFQFAKEIWHGIFLSISTLPDDDAKLQALEQRILHFGKNHRDKISLEEIIEKIRPHIPTIDAVPNAIGNVIYSGVNYINRPIDERTMRTEERQRRRRENPLNWFNPVLWFQSFRDLT